MLRDYNNIMSGLHSYFSTNFVALLQSSMPS